MITTFLRAQQELLSYFATNLAESDRAAAFVNLAYFTNPASREEDTSPNLTRIPDPIPTASADGQAPQSAGKRAASDRMLIAPLPSTR